MRLVIISHTPHYRTEKGFAGWGPTIREINHLTKLFEEIIHIAPLHSDTAPGSSLEYDNEKIKFIPIKPYGGPGFKDKLSILTTALHNLRVIKKNIKQSDWIQFRAPTAMGLYVLPYLSFFRKKNLWVKYAGNWKMENAPVSYRFQKWWLENNFQKSKVTINGHWEGQKEHIINFENPTFDESELTGAFDTGKVKSFEGKLTLCYSGQLAENKGVGLILEALKNLKDKQQIEEVIFAGDGELRDQYERTASGINLKMTFRGFVNRSEIENIYEHSHLILLPSRSEGFPKVIAESAAYGCVPVVSDVSSIGQYFDDSNSFLLKKINAVELGEKINQALSDRGQLKQKSLNCLKVAELFTYERYIQNLKEKIIESN